MRYSKDFRQKVLAFLAKGESKYSLALRFGISRTTVHAWSKNKGIDALKPGPKKPRKFDLLRLQEAVLEHPDAYQDELAGLVGVSSSTIGYHLRRLGYSRKKNDALPSTR
jgi:transposase